MIKYNIIDGEGKLIISAEAKNPLFNKILITGFIIWFVGYSYLKLAKDPNVPFWVFLYVLILGAIGGGIGLLIGREIHKKIGIKMIILDKNKKVLEAPGNNFKISLAEIKDIVITEKTSFSNTISLLKFKLVDGEKTLLFPFQSYDQAKKVLKLIKKNLT